MKGDFSRFTFDRRKHYAGVRLQQGRVQLDADWNEQDDLAAYQRHTLAADLIGPSGAPETDGGFELTVDGNDIRISPGRYYVDGLLCENEEEVSTVSQPDLSGPALPTEDGRYLAYLDVWPRSVTALEDSDLFELALGGADTATRVRTVWQVKLLPLAQGETDFPPGWKPDSRPRPTLAARAAGTPKENQLYRIEVHDPGPIGEATFKWSRDNGAVAALIQNPASSGDSSSQIRITHQIGPDQERGFATDQWIEVTDETRFLQGDPGILAKLSRVEGQVLSVAGWPEPTDPVPDLRNVPQIRRWDSDAAQLVTVPPTPGGYIDLDGTLKVRFGGPTGAYFHAGDYWVVPVRATAGGVRWPTDSSGDPLALLPHGVEHHYAPLYVLERANGIWTRTAYRKVFRGTTVLPGPEKLNRTEDDTMTASLTINGNLGVWKNVKVGQPGTPGGQLQLLDAPLLLAPGGADRGLQFSGTGSGSFLRHSSNRLTLGVGSGSSLALRYDSLDLLTLTSDGLTTSPEANIHLSGKAILVQAETSLVIEKRLTYKDGSQKAGRILTSDGSGNATWQELPTRQLGAPVFVYRFEVAGSPSTTAPTGWIRFQLPSSIPTGIRAVILEGQAAKKDPNSGDIDGYIAIRRTLGASEDILLRARAAGGGDVNAWSNQGLFPVDADNSFEYAIQKSGFDDGWAIYVIGYFP